jgi:hypothetical protein
MNIALDAFLAIFPEARLPITLTEDSQREFGAANEPFNQGMIDQYLIPLEGGEVDEYTEFVPCFKIPKTFDFHALVYWKAGLMNYEYKLVTISKKGDFIAQRTLAGTFYDGKALTTSIATIDEDWQIFIISGQSADGEEYDASNSRHQKLEILPEGDIADVD